MNWLKKILYLKKNKSVLKNVYENKIGLKFQEKYFNRDNIFNQLNENFERLYSKLEKIKLIKNPKSVQDLNFYLIQS